MLSSAAQELYMRRDRIVLAGLLILPLVGGIPGAVPLGAQSRSIGVDYADVDRDPDQEPDRDADFQRHCHRAVQRYLVAHRDLERHADAHEHARGAFGHADGDAGGDRSAAGR